MNSATDSPLFTALRDSGRVPADQQSVVEQAFVEVGNEPDRLAERLLAAGCVTRYQHRKIQLGRTADLLFGPYLILERIGEGGMGKVYRAIQMRLNRQVALKTIRPNLLTNKTVISRYRREARAAAALDHPNIVKLFEADDVDGRYYLAMEFVEGMDLSRLTKELVKDKRTMPPAEAAEYMRQAALGLEHAHGRGLVHRDIKPSNVLVSGERAIPGTGGKASVKLLDMGLVRSLTEDDNTQVDLTRDGTVVGTPDYMSPEQAKNSSTVDHRADIYSLGCTMFYLLRGSPPYSEGTAIDKLIRHQLDPVPDIRQYRPDVPPGLAAVVKRMMAKKPDDRQQTGGEVAKELAMYTDEAARFDFAANTTQPYHYVDLAPPTADPKSNDSLSTAPPAAPATASATVAPTGTRTVRPIAEPQSGTTGQRTVRPIATPPSTPQRSVQVVRPKPIAKPTGDASPSDNLPATDAKASMRERTPVSSPRQRKGQRRSAKKKPAEFPVIPVAVAGTVVIAIFVIAAILLTRGNSTPPTKPSAPEPAKMAQVPVSPYRPVADLLPDNTAAVLIADPKPYWEKAQYDVKAESRERRIARFLADFFKFDPWRFDRVLVAFQPNPAKCVAAGEGGEPLSKPDQFRKDLDLPRFDLETDKNGITLVRAKAGPLKNPFNADRRVRAALLPAPVAYLIGTDAADLADLYKNATTRTTPAGVDPLLLAAASGPATLTTPPPTVFFAASGDFQLPIKSGKTEPLRTLGVELLTVTARLDEKQFQIELMICGANASKLRDFLTVEVPNALEAHAGAAAGKPLADRVRESFDAAPLTDDGGMKKLTAQFTWDWQPVHDAVEKVLPLPLGR